MNNARGYTDVDLADVSDHPEWTAEELAKSMSFAEACPDLAKRLVDGVKVEIVDRMTPPSVHLAEDVFAHYRALGDQWEARLNADLRKIAGLGD